MSIAPSSESPPPRSGTPEGDPIIIDGISYIPSSVLLTGIPKVSFKDDRAFAVVDPHGESPRLYSQGSELGFYCNDTRFLGVWEMTFNGTTAVALARELRTSGNTVVFSMTNADMPALDGGERIRRDTLLIRRILSLHNDTLFETVELKNFDDRPHVIQIEQWIGSRFDDLFEVRGFPRARRGKMLPPEDTRDGGHHVSILRYEGLDDKVRSTYVYRLFEAEKIRVSPTLIGSFTRITIPPKETASLKTIASFDKPSDRTLNGVPFESVRVSEKMEIISKSFRENPLGSLTIHCDNAIMDRAIQGAYRDIFTLLTREEDGNCYPYAGVPWFSAPFGRDGLITAYQLLPWYPRVARGVLDYAFNTLGSKNDPFTDEEPGKVFHEMRRGEMSLTREVPFIPYYGSVDSTPLALILLGEYVKWTMDLENLKRWWPAALRALEWIEKWGDPAGSGFLSYEKRSPTGLVNQGWKDSHDSVMHDNGVLAAPPIRLCEVQAYAFRGRMALSGLARLLGHHGLAARLRLDALNLRSRFQDSYWNAEGRYVHLALDGEMQPCMVKSSNMGHCLWSQILTQEQAVSVSDHLMSPAMFSGYGIRTLADTERAYNPLSYHNGSVWPHDNSLIMEGFRYYSRHRELEELALAAMGVIEATEDFRLPELFCGFRRRGNEPPVPYQVACRPQAWAAGSIYLMLKSMIGISIENDQNYLVFNSPSLTPRIGTLEVRNMPFRDLEVDFVLRRGQAGTSVEILRRTGPVRALIVK